MRDWIVSIERVSAAIAESFCGSSSLSPLESVVCALIDEFKAGDLSFLRAVIIFLLLFLVVQIVSAIKEEEKPGVDYQKRLDNFIEGRRRGRYRRILGQVLDGLAYWIGDRRADGAPRPAFTAQAYLACVFLAFCYPFVFVFGDWVFFAGDGRLGDLPLLNADASQGRRLLALFGLIGAAAGTRWAFQAIENRKPLQVLLALALFFVGAGVVAGAGAEAVAGAVAGAVAFAVALAGAGAGALTGAGAVAVAVAGGFAVTGAVTGVVAGVVASVVAVAGAFALYLTSRFADERKFGWVIGATSALLLLAGAFALFHWGETQGRFRDAGVQRAFEQIAVLLLILPLANAVMDWLSLGLSRWLLGKSADEEGRTSLSIMCGEFFRTIADLFLGLACLLGAAFLTVAALTLVDAIAIGAGAPAVIDVARLLDGMKVEPFAQEYVWVHLLVVTTLFWTLVHVSLGVFSITTQIVYAIPGVNSWIEREYRSRAKQQALGGIADTDHRVMLGAFRGAARFLGLVLSIISAIVFIVTISAIINDTVVALIEGWLIPLHKFVAALCGAHF